MPTMNIDFSIVLSWVHFTEWVSFLGSFIHFVHETTVSLGIVQVNLALLSLLVVFLLAVCLHSYAVNKLNVIIDDVFLNSMKLLYYSLNPTMPIL